jgi:hypothetical protein
MRDNPLLAESIKKSGSMKRVFNDGCRSISFALNYLKMPLRHRETEPGPVLLYDTAVGTQKTGLLYRKTRYQIKPCNFIILFKKINIVKYFNGLKYFKLCMLQYQ